MSERRQEVTARKHVPTAQRGETRQKVGARKVGCNVLTAAKLNGARCGEAFE
jgi:hypothetical protein